MPRIVPPPANTLHLKQLLNLTVPSAANKLGTASNFHKERKLIFIEKITLQNTWIY